MLGGGGGASIKILKNCGHKMGICVPASSIFLAIGQKIKNRNYDC